MSNRHPLFYVLFSMGASRLSSGIPSPDVHHNFCSATVAVIFGYLFKSFFTYFTYLSLTTTKFSLTMVFQYRQLNNAIHNLSTTEHEQLPVVVVVVLVVVVARVVVAQTTVVVAVTVVAAADIVVVAADVVVSA